MSGEPEGFLGRWSRRKRGLGEPEPAPPEATEAEATEAEAAPPEAEVPPPAPRPPASCPVPGLAPVDLSALPRIEDLTLGSDLAPFLRPGIPSALRAAALRRMWSLDPEIRDFIGCVEYQWDFNTPGGLPNGFASELGEGLKQLLAQAIGEPERKPGAENSEAEDPEAENAESQGPKGGDTEPEPLPLAVAEAPQSLPDASPPQAAEEAALPTRRRHGGAMPA